MSELVDLSPQSPVRRKFVDAAIEFVLRTIAAVKDAQTARLDAIEARLSRVADAKVVGELRDRIVEIERRPELKYAGVYRSGATYSPGALVTRGGSLWLCEHPPVGEPGAGGSGWRLVVKSGRV